MRSRAGERQVPGDLARGGHDPRVVADVLGATDPAHPGRATATESASGRPAGCARNRSTQVVQNPQSPSHTSSARSSVGYKPGALMLGAQSDATPRLTPDCGIRASHTQILLRFGAVSTHYFFTGRRFLDRSLPLCNVCAYSLASVVPPFRVATIAVPRR